MANSTSTPTRFLRLEEVLRRIPVSRASWYIGVKKGLYPPKYKIGPRASAWRESDIDALAERILAHELEGLEGQEVRHAA